MQEEHLPPEKNFYLSALQLSAARLVHHPLAQFGMTWVAKANNLLSKINPLLAYSNFVHYVFASPLMQVKRLVTEEIKERGHAANSYVAGTILGLGGAVFSGVPLVLVSVIFDLSAESQAYLWINWLNAFIELNNANDRGALTGIDSEGFSFVSMSLGTGLAFGTSFPLVQRVGLTGFVWSAMAGNALTNILNKSRLLCSGKIFREINSEELKEKIIYLLQDGSKNALTTAINMAPVPVLSWRVANYSAPASSTFAIAYGSWNVTDSIARGFMNATGRRLNRFKLEEEKRATANRGVICVSSISSIFALFFIIFARQTLGIFTQDETVLDQANLFRMIIAAEMVVPIRDSQANVRRVGWDENLFTVMVSVLSTAFFLTSCFVSPFGKSAQKDSIMFLASMGLSAVLISGGYAYKMLKKRAACCFFKDNYNEEGQATEMTQLIKPSSQRPEGP